MINLAQKWKSIIKNIQTWSQVTVKQSSIVCWWRMMVLYVVVLNFCLRFVLNSNVFPCLTSPHSWSGVQRWVFKWVGCHELEVNHLSLIFHLKKKQQKNRCGGSCWYLCLVGFFCRAFSNFQYFDSKGMFISLVYSIPLLLNTIIIVVSFIIQHQCHIKSEYKSTP